MYVHAHTLPTWFDHGLLVREDVCHFHEVLGMHQVPDVVTNDINLPEGGRGRRRGGAGEGGREKKCKVALIPTAL